jgi:signal transduction histidine kinase
VHGLADRPQGRIRVAAEVADGWVTLHVSDDGCGIPPHLHERIFEPFFTTRLGQGGSGLGLHIAHNIVTGMLGGRITFDSEVGRGTTFHIACPLAAPRDAKSESRTDAA